MVLRPGVIVPALWVFQQTRYELEMITDQVIEESNRIGKVAMIPLRPGGWMLIMDGEYWFLSTEDFEREA